MATLIGTAGNDTLAGLAPNDNIDGLDGNDSLSGGAGNDTLFGGAGTDTLDGGDGNDVLYGDAGNDLMQGGAGTDDLLSGAGNDTLDGGDGDADNAYYQYAPAAVNVNLATGLASDGEGGTDTLRNIERVSGSAFNDTLTGNDGDNFFWGLAGNDSINGGAGFDMVWWGYGNLPINASLLTGTATGDGTDTLLNIEGLWGGGGSDTLVGNALDNRLLGGAGNDSLQGGAGNDYLVGDGGSDTLDGGEGNADSADYFAAPAAVNANLATGTASDGQGGTDTLRNLEQLGGSEFNDTLVGNAADNLLWGRGGDDRFEGGAGIDTVSFTFSAAAVSATLNFGPGSGSGGINEALGEGRDVLVDIENLVGSSFADTLQGSAGANDLWGGAGNDTLLALGGDDFLDGSDGLDSLVGGDGQDVLRGGAGNDTLDGGAGTFDEARWDDAPAAVNANLATGTASDGFGGTDRLLGIEGLLGSRFADTLTGGLAANGTTAVGERITDGFENFAGMAGNDTIDGGQGYDRADYSLSTAAVVVVLGANGTAQDGNGGTDTLRNIEGVLGSAFNDTLTGSAAPFEAFEGGPGADSINGGDGIDELRHEDATALQAVLVNLATQTATDGFGDRDTLRSIEWARGTDAFGDTLIGSDGDNRLDGAGGNDSIVGGAGNDTLIPGTGTDTMDGGDGDDLAVLPLRRSVVVVDVIDGSTTRLANLGVAFDVQLRNVERVQFSDGEVVALSSLLDPTLRLGGPGDDSLIGTADNDRMDGGAGNDTLKGGAGDDRLFGNAGNDLLDGGSGRDTADYSRAPASVRIDLTSNLHVDGWGGQDTLTSVEAVVGSAFNDWLYGNNDLNVLAGGPGSDTLNGAGGIDIADYRGAVAVQLNLHLGTATQVNASIGVNDQDTLSFIEAVFGSSAADTLRGRDGLISERDDTLRGNGGNDTLNGGDGNDSAEWLGPRSDYTVTRVNTTTWTVRDNNPANGDEGTDTVTGIERLVFADQLLALGPRAEDLARLAFPLWSSDILPSTAFWSRAFSYYDNGYAFATAADVALQFWPQQGREFAELLVRNSGTSKSVAQVEALMAAASAGGTNPQAGRVAALLDIALDPATTAMIEASGLRSTGLVADLAVPGFGVLFELLPG